VELHRVVSTGIHSGSCLSLGPVWPGLFVFGNVAWLVIGSQEFRSLTASAHNAHQPFRALYLPRKVGLRRSRKAATPSKWSSALLAIANWSTSM
jgi:hypothetical protein